MEIHNCRITNTHVFFWGSIFSNWHPCEFEFDDKEFGTHKFKNTEQAFMWLKAKYFQDEETAEEILVNPNPRTSKKLGRKVKGFDDEKWAMVSYVYMIAVNASKYIQNEDLKQTLFSTAGKQLVEASPFDKIWGIGISKDDDDCLDEHKWKGMNLLGKALDVVRDIIINKEVK